MAIAKIPTVSNFLCYFELTTGGLILGYFDAIINGIVLAFALLFLILLSVLESKQLARHLDNFTASGESRKFKLEISWIEVFP